MKSALYLLLPALLAASCTPSERIEFTGKAPGITSGAFLIKDGDKTIFSNSIKNGTFKAEGNLEHAGYYEMALMDNGNIAEKHGPFEVYLEPGKYNIIAGSNLDDYPEITTSSGTQKDLSAYYAIRGKNVGKAEEQVNRLKEKLNDKKQTESRQLAVTASLMDAQAAKQTARLDALKAFITAYPNSAISAHLMADLDYEQDPAAYNAIFQKFSTAAKNSEEGKSIGLKLSTLMKLQPGAPAPAIAGTTPDGKRFDKAALNKKVYVIDFWRAANEVSRLNHQNMLDMLYGQVDAKKTGIISISLDRERNWWTTAIQQDKLTWPQYSDLKGDESANAQNWMITTIPTYYLVDGNWNIIMRDVTLSRIPFEVKEYLKKAK